MTDSRTGSLDNMWWGEDLSISWTCQVTKTWTGYSENETNPEVLISMWINEENHVNFQLGSCKTKQLLRQMLQNTNGDTLHEHSNYEWLSYSWDQLKFQGKLQ